ncbi:hypothetical protein [Floridanema aerugineum]|uniref:Uncharacterized protein n=1 Tax=Floridaenema aerugineum BLCC-F46 TaxID=3153654 RepID=A0ABV4XF56_9CYAN
MGEKVGESIKKNWKKRGSPSRRENNPTNWDGANDAYNKSKTNEENPSIPRPGKPDTTPTLRLPMGGSGSQTIEIFFRLGSWRVEKNPTEAPYPLITSGRSPFLSSGRVEQYGNSVANYIKLSDVPFPLQYQFVNGSPQVKDANNRLIFQLTVSSETNYGELGNIQQWSGQYLDLLDIRPINYQSPMPIRNPNPFINEPKEEDDMSCRPCQAAQALRALQRTVTVESVNIVRIPTGNMVQVPTVETHRVFALPGTEFAVKRQFDLIADIRKRLASTFNQSRMAKVLAKLSQLMQVTDFILNLHNALMLTEDIVQTFWSPITGMVDTVFKVLDDVPLVGDLFDLEETPINSSQWLSDRVEQIAKQVFGVQGWAEIKAKWASFNNIVRGAAMQIQAVKDIHESQKELQEMTASKLGRLHNKMLKAGVIFDSSPWEENVKARSVWLNKFYKLEELADDNPITNAASYVNSWGQQVLDIKEQKKELKESQEKYQKDLRDDLNTLTTGKIKTNEESLGAPYTRSDGNAPETDDAQ